MIGAIDKKDLYKIGELPPLGHVPKNMYAQVIRPERYGVPTQAFAVEQIATPRAEPGEALVAVMAAGVNYNNVWAGLGVPVDIVQARLNGHDPMSRDPFHIGGSDASGIVYAVGEGVDNVKVGDHVVVHCGMWDTKDPWILKGGDPIVSTTNRIWGYETNWGSFAQFTRVQAHQLLPKPKHLTWEEAACYMLVGATAWRMLMGWSPHTVERDDVVLIWGASGGLGSIAIQIVREQGGLPVAVVSDESKFKFCEDLGAVGCINRTQFDHWGMPPHWKDTDAFAAWTRGARAFGKAIREIVGPNRNPRIVFEHPGESTLPTSAFVCDNGGMITICAGTTGYTGVVDLRYLWMRQKRLQGSHFANDAQCAAFNDLVCAGRIDPCLSKTFRFEGIPDAHQLMYENRHPAGNMACLVSAAEPGLGAEKS
jgi:crotonyl-CoA carboxylase/reductase